MLTRYQSATELLVASMIWGFGFTATLWALQSVDPVSMTIIRFVIAFAIGHLVLFLPKLRKEISWENLFISAVPGVLLGVMIVLQTWGLKYTSVTNSGFITTLYVVLVPILDNLVYKQRIYKFHFLWVLIALMGTALMVNVLNMSTLNKGDVLSFACAILASLQIIIIGKIGPKITSAIALNTYQSIWAAIGAIAFWPMYSMVNGNTYLKQPTSLALIGLISLTLGSTLLGFALQIKAQKYLSSSAASVIFLLESPFAALFAFLLLGDVITPLQTVGGLLIFLAALASIKTPQLKTRVR